MAASTPCVEGTIDYKLIEDVMLQVCSTFHLHTDVCQEDGKWMDIKLKMPILWGRAVGVEEVEIENKLKASIKKLTAEGGEFKVSESVVRQTGALNRNSQPCKGSSSFFAKPSFSPRSSLVMKSPQRPRRTRRTLSSFKVAESEEGARDEWPWCDTTCQKHRKSPIK